MIKIECPNCKREYLPSEIFYPDEFFGNPKTIVRDTDGKIMGITGADMNTSEVFECEICGQQFKINTNLTFTTTKVKPFNTITIVNL